MDLAAWDFASDVEASDGRKSNEAINNFLLRNESAGVEHEVAVSYISHASAPTLKKQRSQTAYDRFSATKAEALHFVIDDAYPNRRGHWSGEFRNYLHKVADQYERESTYINVSKRQKSSRERKLGATIRLIVEKNGLTPMEDYLNIRLKNESGFLKVEPGNFAIDPNANEISWMEIGAHLIAQMRRYEDVYKRDAIFVTYADAFSQRLYKKLGFEFVKSDALEISDSKSVRIDKNGRTFFFKDGVDWAPMAISRARLERQMLMKTLSPASNMASASLAAYNSGLPSPLKPDVDIFSLQQNLFNLPGVARIGTLPNLREFQGQVQTVGSDNEPLRLLIADRADGKSELFLQFYDKWQIGWFRNGQTLPLPRLLTEGWSGEAVGIFGLMKMHYADGVLVLEEASKTGPHETYFIKIDAEMKNATTLSLQRIGFGPIQKQFSLQRRTDTAIPDVALAH